ncbi:MAG TPA: hypothetical protein VHZ32_16855, partial [Rhizomicrobium sp.]|nr:hypothetical protein [Rhizomicrobium sp.]
MAVEQRFAPLARYFFPALQVDDSRYWVRITRTTRAGTRPADRMVIAGAEHNLLGEAGSVPVIMKIDKCNGAILEMSFDKDKLMAAVSAANTPAAKRPMLPPVAQKPPALPVINKPVVVASKPVANIKPVANMELASKPVANAQVAGAPAASKPVVNKPVANTQMASAPAASKPVVNKPVANTQVASTPAASKPVADKPVASTQMASAPAASKPVADKPVASTQMASTPAASKPVADKPVASTQMASTPAASTPAASKPVANTQVASKPVRQTPSGSPSPEHMADVMIRMFGHDAESQARENAASNARAGDSDGEKMWLAVADIVSDRTYGHGLRGRI